MPSTRQSGIAIRTSAASQLGHRPQCAPCLLLAHRSISPFEQAVEKRLSTTDSSAKTGMKNITRATMAPCTPRVSPLMQIASSIASWPGRRSC